MRYEDFSNIILVLSLLHELLVYNFYELIKSSALSLGISDISTKTLSKFTVEFISVALSNYPTFQERQHYGNNEIDGSKSQGRQMNGQNTEGF